jgi:hypothetical protein
VNLWLLTGLTIAGCYLLKLAGYVVPSAWMASAKAQRLLALLPVALLAGLVIVEAFADGRHWDFNGPRLAGVGAGIVAVWRKAPFLVVVVVAAVTAALLRAI